MKDREAHWRRHVKQWKTSGESLAAYARKHDFTPQALGYWVRRLESAQVISKKRPKIRRFVPVEISKVVPHQAPSAIRVALPDGTTIECGSSDLELVAKLAQMLRGRSVT